MVVNELTNGRPLPAGKWHPLHFIIYDEVLSRTFLHCESPQYRFSLGSLIAWQDHSGQTGHHWPKAFKHVMIHPSNTRKHHVDLMDALLAMVVSYSPHSMVFESANMGLMGRAPGLWTMGKDDRLSAKVLLSQSFHQGVRDVDALNSGPGATPMRGKAALLQDPFWYCYINL